MKRKQKEKRKKNELCVTEKIKDDKTEEELHSYISIMAY